MNELAQILIKITILFNFIFLHILFPYSHKHLHRKVENN